MDELQIRRLAALAEMALERTELQVLMQRVVDTAEEFLPADAASLLLWDASTETFTVSSSSVPGQPAGRVLQTIRSRGGASRAIVDRQEPIAVSDVNHDQFGASPLLVETGLRAYVGVPLLFESESIGVLYALDRQVRTYTDPDVDFLTLLARRAASSIGLARLFEQLEELARTDELTGLSNRREFFSRGRTEFEREARSDRPLSAILIDIDEFKDLNDTYGHAAGDAVLAEVAHRIRGELRAFDLVGRLGGEEFAVLLPEVERTLAARIAERIRRAVSDAPITTSRGALTVTITLGVADRSGAATSLTILLDRADSALYDGKAAGRNRVCVLDETGPIRHGSTALVTRDETDDVADADTDAQSSSADPGRDR